MNQNENLEITIPSTEYLQNSRLIQKIGFQTTNYTNTYEDYWTNTIVIIILIAILFLIK